MYAAHQDGQSLRTDFSAPSIHYDRDGNPASFWGLRGSASLHGKKVVLTAVNPSVKDALETQIVLRGARIGSAEATVLTADDIHAHNTFEQRDALVPKSQRVEMKNGTLSFRFPGASVTRLDLQLA
jgi:alpha-N-arabinofuranosidase